MSSNCCACGTGNGFEDHGWLNISPTKILQFANEDTSQPTIQEQNWFICQTCATYATAAWAREERRKNVIRNPPPEPTNSPVGSGTSRIELLQNVA